MVWCLSTLDVEFDIDLLFMENMTIKERIFLTECIVKALNKIKCPFKIEPHQIQGYDLFNIYPLLQWLVKIAISSRSESSSLTTKSALWNFEKKFGPDKSKLSLELSNKNFRSFPLTYPSPKRQYKKNSDFKPSSVILDVAATINEYGQFTKDEKYDYNEEKRGDSVKQNTNESKFENLIPTDSHLQVRIIESVVDRDLMNSIEINNEIGIKQSKINESIKKLRNLPLNPKQEEEFLVHSLEELVKKYNSKLSDLENFQETIAKEKAELENVKKTSSALLNEVETLKSSLNCDEKQIEKIKNDIEHYSKTKNKKSSLKSKYKTRIEELNKKLEESKEKQINGIQSIELKKQIEAAEEMYQNEMNRIKEARQAIAKRSRRFATLKLKFEDSPTKAELILFQKRFLELYNQVSIFHNETDHHYNLFNTFSDIVAILNKEKNILTSIKDTFPKIVSSPQGQVDFRNSLESILKGTLSSYKQIQQNYDKDYDVFKSIFKRHKEIMDKQFQYRRILITIRKKLEDINADEVDIAQ